jgi:hypothetical protein
MTFKTEFDGDFELHTQHRRLMRAPRFQRPAFRRCVKVIEADLANGADLGMPRQFPQFILPRRAAYGIDIAGMDAHRDTHIRLLFRDGEQLAGIFEIDRRSHHARDARLTSTLEHRRQIRVELLAAEMRVGIEKHAPPHGVDARECQARCLSNAWRSFLLAKLACLRLRINRMASQYPASPSIAFPPTMWSMVRLAVAEGQPGADRRSMSYAASMKGPDHGFHPAQRPSPGRGGGS